MTLKSHTVTRIDDNETNLKTFELTNEQNKQIIVIRNDFTKPCPGNDSITVGVLIDLLNQALEAPLPVPQTHAGLWRQIRQNAALLRNNYAYSESLRELEILDSTAINVRFELPESTHVRNGIDIPPALLLYRLRRFTHVHNMEGTDNLVIRLYQMPPDGVEVDVWLNSLLDMDGAYPLTVYEKGTAVYEHAVLQCEYPVIDSLIAELKTHDIEVDYDAETQRIDIHPDDPGRVINVLDGILNP